MLDFALQCGMIRVMSMTQKDSGGWALARQSYRDTEDGAFHAGSAGMTMRQYYAAMAIMGAAVGPEPAYNVRRIARRAWQLADEMIRTEKGDSR